MIKLENYEVVGLQHAIRGMRNPMNSWGKSDSGICKGGDSGIGCENCAGIACTGEFNHSFHVGKNDHELMTKLVKAGPVHGKFRRMIAVYVDITAPLYWWKEFDTYKVGTVANSCSTMHKIHENAFALDDFSHDHLIDYSLPGCNEQEDVFIQGHPTVQCGGLQLMLLTVNVLNLYRKRFLETKEKKFWWQMIQLLPSSYNQRRTVMLSYEVLAGIYQYRKDHKLDEWREFCQWIEELPNSDIFTCKGEQK